MHLTFVKLLLILLVGYVGLSGVTFHFLNKNIEVRLCDLEDEDDLEDEVLEDDLDDSLEDTEDLDEDELGEFIEERD